MVAQENIYAYTAVQIADGDLDTLILPHVDGNSIQLFLEEVAARHRQDRIMMVLDGTGWRQTESLTLADNLRLIKLPSYARELSPVEHHWDNLREKPCYIRAFESIDALETHLVNSARGMEFDHQHIRSIEAWPWTIGSLKS